MPDTSLYFDGKRPLDIDFGELRKEDFKDKKRVKIDDLTPNQYFVNSESIQLKRRGKNLTTPFVGLYKGVYILFDGHHTVIAKKLNGQKYITALTTIINK